MTTFNETYDDATPDGSDDPAECDDKIREVKAAVQERENVDHYWPETGTEVSDEDAGEHRKVTLRVGSAPTKVTDKGFVYAKDVSGKAELFYIDEDGNEVQITSGGILKSLNLTGVQTAAGIKTFGSIPVLPASNPTANNQATRKKYVVDQIASNITGLSQIKVSTYTGNGSTTQAITGVGFQPDIVLIMPHRGNPDAISVIKTSAMGTYSKFFNDLGAYLNDAIISLDTDGFTVGDVTGSAVDYNANGRTYSYLALKTHS